MFVYIFESHPQKEYLVGAIVIIARSFSHAVEVYNQYSGGIHNRVVLVREEAPLVDWGRDTFVLVSKIPTSVKTPRVVLTSWGYLE